MQPIETFYSDYSKLPWSDYFDQQITVPIEGDKFRVYEAGSIGPSIVLLHGGGYTSLTWSLTAVRWIYECHMLF